jgi:cell division septal protein FtsQ
MDKTSVPVSIRLPEEQLRYLKKMSHYMSIEQNTDLSYVDLIRTAIEQVYPMPVGLANDNQVHGS